MQTPVVMVHWPQVVESDPKTGSSVYVSRIIEGFEANGYRVELVTGESRARRRAMRRLQKLVVDGASVELVFAIASTAPTVLSDSHHLPVRPVLDWRFFRWVKRQGIPIGLFYPDVYWRFDEYSARVPTIKRWLAILMYRYDLWWYRDVLDVLFLPSTRMAAWVPGWERSERVAALPPGGASSPLDWIKPERGVHLFYVGSVTPPIYDIAPLLDAVRSVPGAHLTICCPRDQADFVTDAIGECERIDLVHEHGDAVVARYRACDVACLFFADDPYRSFAMPVKLFEAVGLGRPVIASAGTAVGDLVEAAGLGWVVDAARLPELLGDLAERPELIARRRAVVIEQSAQHRWSDRAAYIARVVGSSSVGGVLER